MGSLGYFFSRGPSLTPHLAWVLTTVLLRDVAEVFGGLLASRDKAALELAISVSAEARERCARVANRHAAVDREYESEAEMSAVFREVDRPEMVVLEFRTLAGPMIVGERAPRALVELGRRRRTVRLAQKVLRQGRECPGRGRSGRPVIANSTADQ